MKNLVKTKIKISLTEPLQKTRQQLDKELLSNV